MTTLNEKSTINLETEELVRLMAKHDKQFFIAANKIELVVWSKQITSITIRERFGEKMAELYTNLVK